MKKGDVYQGTVETVLFPNRGVLSVEGQTVLVKGTLPGQSIRFRISKKKNQRIEGRLLEIVAPSPLETADPLCPIHRDCGGCSYRTLPYETQLRLKEEVVRHLLEPLLAWDHVFLGMRRSPQEVAYRNKMEYTFGDCEKGGELMLGLHRQGSRYDILPANACAIVHADCNRVVACVQEWARANGLPAYHRRTHEGYLRHLLVRRADRTGELLIALVTTSAFAGGAAGPATEQKEATLLQELTERLCACPLEGTVVGILHTRNDSVADTIQNEHSDLLFGRPFFYEELLGLRFQITPFSFFQTNSRGAEVLYTTAQELLGDVQDQVVFDLYSGTGTIAQVLAPFAKKVVGVEIVEEAVKAARENAALNGLTNCVFQTGDVLQVLDTMEERPDVIVLDPPREGVHPKALPKILAYGVDRILYISCKPSSLARDLPVFHANGYTVAKLCCIDLFPATVHCEVVCLLQKGSA